MILIFLFVFSAIAQYLFLWVCSGGYAEWKWKKDHYIDEETYKKIEEELVKRGCTPYGKISYDWEDGSK